MCWWCRARTVSPGKAGMLRSRRWRRSAIPTTRCRWGRPFRPITGWSRRATCMNTASRQEDLAEFAVLMRDHASAHPGAQFHDRITVADVMAPKPVALPLKLLDCCPVSDGGAAFVVSRERTGEAGVRVRGCAQAHTHQHVTTIPLRCDGRARSPLRPAPRPASRYRRRALCRALRQFYHYARDAAGRTRPRRRAAKRRRGCASDISAATARCRSIPMAVCSATAIAASAARWRIWWRRSCR